MATARPKPAPSPVPKARAEALPPPEPLLVRAFDAIFRFLASLKLAVMLISGLAAVLASGTIYESMYGTAAVQHDIYQSKWFALLLAGLGVNILCAALIRFPWKRRQTGFVITHAGLIILLIGSFASIKLADEGRVAVSEGASSDTYFRPDDPVFRIQKLDPDTGRPTRGFVLGFLPGAAAWESEQRAALMESRAYVSARSLERMGVAVLAVSLFAAAVVLSMRRREWVSRPLGALAVAGIVSAGLISAFYAWMLPVGPRREVLSDASDPFRFVVKDFLPSSSPLRDRHEPAEKGPAMLRAALLVQRPGETEASDALDGQGWLVANETLDHGALNLGPARLSFQRLKGATAAAALDDFLNPPKDASNERRLRIRYQDLQGEPRVYDWTFPLPKPHDHAAEEDPDHEHEPDPAENQTITLPESDISITLIRIVQLPLTAPELVQNLGPNLNNLLLEIREATQATAWPVALLTVKKGDGPPATQWSWAGLPTVPQTVGGREGSSRAPLVDVSLYYPPLAMGGGAQLGVIEFVTTEDSRWFHRIIGRDGVRGIGPMRFGEVISAFGGDQMPMKVAVRPDEFLPAGRTREVCDPLPLPKDQADRAIPAALVEFSVNGDTREFWIRRSAGLSPTFKLVEVDGQPWQVAFDFGSSPLGFSVELVDADPSFDPGTSARSAYRSDVVVRKSGEQPARPMEFRDLPEGGYFTFAHLPRQAYRKLGPDQFQAFDGGELRSVDDPKSSVQPLPKPTKITMNNPMVHQGWTFYQSNFEQEVDRRGEPTGSYTVIYAVRYDPAWPIVYGGCAVIVLGIFVQFYMRAGVFTDGGKRERERLQARAAKSAEPVAAGAVEEDL